MVSFLLQVGPLTLSYNSEQVLEQSPGPVRWVLVHLQLGLDLRVA